MDSTGNQRTLSDGIDEGDEARRSRGGSGASLPDASAVFRPTEGDAVYRSAPWAGVPQGAQAQTFLDTEQPVFRSLSLPADVAAAPPAPPAFDSSKAMGLGGLAPPSFGGASAPMDFEFEGAGGLAGLGGLAPPKLGGLEKPTLANVSVEGWVEPASREAPAAVAAEQLDQIKVLPLPQPACLEPNSHCFVRGTAPELARAITDALLAADVDFVFKAEKGKWKAKWYSQCHQLVEFRVRLWQQSGRLVCELQRRQGCCVSFRGLWTRVEAALVGAGVAVGVDGAAKAPAAQTQTLPAGLAPPVLSNAEAARLIPSDGKQPEPGSEAMDALVAMAAAPFAGPRAEALRVFAGMAASAEGAAALRAAGALPAVVAALGGPCGDARRCAAAAAASVAEHVQLQGALVDSQAVGALLGVVTAPLAEESSLELDARREAARALANLSEAYAAEITEAGGAPLRAMLDACDSIPDARLRGHAMRARTRIIAV